MTQHIKKNIGRKGSTWSEAEVDILKQYYPVSPQTAYGMIKITFPGWERGYVALRAKAKAMRLSNMHNIGGHFVKGHIPWNKGKKVPIQDNAIKTQFKPGNIPANHRPVGSIVVRSRRNRFKRSGDPVKYQWIKIAEPNKWELLHRYLWKKEHGEFPKGKIIVFKNGNPLECCIDNLEAITRRENMIRNQNREKFKKTCEELTDKQIAGRLSYNDPEKRKYLMGQRDLLDIHRKSIQLKRIINKIES